METVMEKGEERSKRKSWYQTKIEQLEAALTERDMRISGLHADLLNMAPPSGEIKLSADEIRDGIHYESFAEGYAACLTKYALLPKEKRRIIKANLVTQGPRYVGQSAWTRMKF